MQTFRGLLIGGLDKAALLARLTDAGVQFNAYAQVLFSHPSFSPGPATPVSLTKAQLSELELSEPCSYSAILSRASELGLYPCPLYLAAFLRLELLDQPEGPYVTIASHQLDVSDDQPTGLYLRNIAGVLWLRGYRVIGEAAWPADNEFVFMR